MNNNPLVSIVFTSYNHLEFLKQAIESILNQTFSNFEFIIINDGSTDESDKIIRSYDDSRIIYQSNSCNSGLIATLNVGISLSRGKYIARMDADDISYRNRFSIQYDYLEKNENVVLCGSWAKIIDSNGKESGRIKRINSHQLLRANMLFTTPFIHPSVMIRTESIKKEKFSENAIHCEDLELWLRLSLNTNNLFANIPKYLLKYRIHEKNISVEFNDFQLEHRKEILKPYIESFIPLNSIEDELTHFSLFQSKPLTKKEKARVKDWISKLVAANKEQNIFQSYALNALLFSRWIIICSKSKDFLQILNIKLPWFHPKTIWQTLKLLLFK